LHPKKKKLFPICARHKGKTGKAGKTVRPEKAVKAGKSK